MFDFPGQKSKAIIFECLENIQLELHEDAFNNYAEVGQWITKLRYAAECLLAGEEA